MAILEEFCSKTPQSPPSDSESKSKSICFAGYNWKQRQTKWYVFELSDGSNSKKNNNIDDDDYSLFEILKSFRLPEGVSLIVRHSHVGDDKFGRGLLRPIPLIEEEEETLEYLYWGSCVAMGSVIYRCGSMDSRKLHNRVACYDLKCPQQSGGWKSFSPMMITPRYKANAVALDGKLYVMGGGVSCPWGEVYDPCVNKWEPIPPPPLKSFYPPPSDGFVAIVDASEKKILVKFHSQFIPPLTRRSCLYAYDTRTNSWEVVDGVERLHCQNGAVVVDGTVFWLGRGNLEAFNLERKSWCICCIEGLEEEDVIHECFSGVDPTLLHVEGDQFCIFWVANEDKGLEGGAIRSHCVKIRIVSKPDCRLEGGERGGEFKLNAFVESCQSYTLDDEKMKLFGALICC